MPLKVDIYQTCLVLSCVPSPFTNTHTQTHISKEIHRTLKVGVSLFGTDDDDNNPKWDRFVFATHACLLVGLTD
jgi:hypothetical protein